MAKTSVQYVCSECGWSGPKWLGRCPECGQWGTVEEFREARPTATTATGNRTAAPGRTARTTAGVVSAQAAARPITDITTDTVTRIPTGFGEFDRVLGGGIVPGSVVLIAGEPGIGKSTLLLETAGNIARAAQQRGTAGKAASTGASTTTRGHVTTRDHATDHTAADNTPNTATNVTASSITNTTSTPPRPVLYISGEESLAQVRLRAARINAVEPNLLLASTTDLATALGLIEQTKPALAIVDSAQTIVSQDVDGISGGSTQVREVASALIDTAKRLDVPVLLVGHVTKDGSIAGPRTLEHLVDVVCQFEGDSQTALRMLRAVKNRFGPTDEVGCFDMSGEGIEEVNDPSGLFLSSTGVTDANGTATPPVEGTCVTFTLDGHRSLPIEVQSLVTSSVLPTPRRAVNGVDTNRIAMLTAVLYRHGKVNLLANDLYVSTIAGGLAKEPACDLAIVAALASAAKSRPIARTTCAIGEISLTGQVRPVPRLEYRLREAARLGFTTAVVPPLRKKVNVPGLHVIEVNTLKDALDAIWSGTVK
ncbi:DNA repair protein RadA [Bifidobacterium hapali]|nr:DnaB-like helicase C-terminal domain-containing protein [Bifidobacterium hapali]